MTQFGFHHLARRMPWVAGLLIVAVLAGCGGSLNPFKWFGKRDRPVAAVSVALPADPRPLIATITAARMERVPGGAVLTATGQGAAAGSWKADLVASPPQDGVLTLEFRAWPGPGTGAAGPRAVTVGLYLRAKDLAGLRKIIVQGAENARVLTP